MNDGDQREVNAQLDQWKVLAQIENKRARALWDTGDEDKVEREPVQLTSAQIVKQMVPRLAPFFEAGWAPEAIAERSEVPESLAWRALASHMRGKVGGKKKPPIFYRMRATRVGALVAQGHTRLEVAAILDVSDGTIDVDLKRFRDMQGSGGEACEMRLGFRTVTRAGATA